MDDSLFPNQQTDHLVAYLTARREALLGKWRTACELDPDMHSAAALSREEFNDQVPTLLNILGHCLLGKNSEADAVFVAAQHGWHRWHNGYQLQELVKEISCLRACLLTEIGSYWNQFPQSSIPLIQQVYEQVGDLFDKAVTGSVLKYDELKAITAADRAQSLQQALDDLGQLEQERGELLRMTSHDLRSGLGVVEGAAQLMDLPGNTDQDREKMLEMMQRNLANVRDLLHKLSDLARLEANQDTVNIESFDVSVVIGSLIDSFQPTATARGLRLLADGPDKLPVETDRLKIQRIVQNLLLNAIAYTPAGSDGTGWISVSWVMEDSHRWSISVQDSGPGLPPGPTNQLAAQLIPIVELTSIFRKDEEHEPIKQMTAPPPGPVSGEGLGLHIVKRLCELLHANMDIEINTGVGTLFRIRLLTKWH